MSHYFHEIVTHPEKVNAEITLHCPGEKIFDFHWHEDIELIGTLDSRVEVSHVKGGYQVGENDVAIVNSCQVHRIAPLPGWDKKGISLHINPGFVKSNLSWGEAPFFVLRDKPTARKKLSDYMWELYRTGAAQEKDPYYLLYVNGLMHQILYLLLSECQEFEPPSPETRTEKYRQRFREIMIFMEEHYAEPLTLDEVSGFAHVSREHLSREFKNYVGENFHTHLANIRLRHAHNDLLGTDLSLIDIAVKHGFSDLRCYNRAFEKRFGTSPAKYRRSVRRQSPRWQSGAVLRVPVGTQLPLPLESGGKSRIC